MMGKKKREIFSTVERMYSRRRYMGEQEKSQKCNGSSK